jgi:hypothetical protein
MTPAKAAAILAVAEMTPAGDKMPNALDFGTFAFPWMIQRGLWMILQLPQRPQRPPRTTRGFPRRAQGFPRKI